MTNSLTSSVIYSLSKNIKFNKNPNILSLANGKDFYCYDIEGITLTLNQFLKLTLDTPANILFAVGSLDLILTEENSRLVYLTYDAALTMTYRCQFKKIKANIYDRLLADYEPETIFGFSDEYTIDASRNTLNRTIYTFFS